MTFPSSPGPGWSTGKLRGSGNNLFYEVNRVLQGHVIASLVTTWLPGGKKRGQEWVARNPRRSDNHPGSFSVNLASGRWADFATGDKGGDIISLLAYLDGISQIEAARFLAEWAGLPVKDRRQHHG